MKSSKLSAYAGLGQTFIFSRHTERILDFGNGRNRSDYRHGMAIDVLDARKCDLLDSPLPVVRGCLKDLPVTVMPAGLNERLILKSRINCIVAERRFCGFKPIARTFTINERILIP